MADDISQDELDQLISEFTFARTLEARKEEFLPGHKYYKYGSYLRLERTILSYFSEDFSRKFPRGPAGVLKRGDYDTDPGSYAPCVNYVSRGNSGTRLHFVKGEYDATNWNPSTICGYPVAFLVSLRRAYRAQNRAKSILEENYNYATAMRRDKVIENRVSWIGANLPLHTVENTHGVWAVEFKQPLRDKSRAELIMENFGLGDTLTDKAKTFINKVNSPRLNQTIANVASHVKALDLVRQRTKNTEERRRIDQIRKTYIDLNTDLMSGFHIEADNQQVFKAPDAYNVEKSTQSFLCALSAVKLLTSTITNNYRVNQNRLFTDPSYEMSHSGFTVHFWANSKTEAQAFVSVLTSLVAPSSSRVPDASIRLSHVEHTDDPSLAITMNKEQFENTRKSAMNALASLTARVEILRDSLENVEQYFSIYEDLIDSKSMDAPGVYQPIAAADVE